MAMAYVPPGVLPVRELQPSPLTPGNVTSQVVPVLIGESRGYQTYSESIVLDGTATVTLAKKGIVIGTATTPNLSFTVSKPVSYEVIGPGNFIISQTAGTATGDETTTVRAVAYPGTPTATPATAVGTVVPAGQYRYAVSLQYSPIEALPVSSVSTLISSLCSLRLPLSVFNQIGFNCIKIWWTLSEV
jgi:hypothetical protein